MASDVRLVVCVLGGQRGPLELPASEVDDDRSFISGGERSLYELAAAAAVLGIDVELRGQINRAVFDTVTAAAGAAPRTGLPSRRPERGDLVVVPAAAHLGLYAAVHLSEARGVIDLLGPPGLSGWDFLGPERPAPDPWIIPVDQVGRPDSFRAMWGLGFDLWTNAVGIEEAGRRADVPVTWIGTGSPVTFPDIPVKTHDVAIIESNRWHAQADSVAAALPGVSVLRIPPVPHVYSLASFLAPARLLIWPSRLEGMSRIAREARSAGTIPVALSTNPFAVAEDHTDGVVLVDDLDELATTALELLGDPDRIASQRSRAIASAQRQVDWPAFVARVEAAVAATTDRSGSASTRPSSCNDLAATARVYLGNAVHREVGHMVDRFDDLEAHLRGVIDDRVRAELSTARARDEALSLATALRGEVEAFRLRRSVQLADSLAMRRFGRRPGPPTSHEDLVGTPGVTAPDQAEVASPVADGSR